MRVSWKHYLKTAGVVQVGGRGTGALEWGGRERERERVVMSALPHMAQNMYIYLTVVLPWDTKTTGTCGNLGGNMCCALGPGLWIR